MSKLNGVRSVVNAIENMDLSCDIDMRAAKSLIKIVKGMLDDYIPKPVKSNWVLPAHIDCNDGQPIDFTRFIPVLDKFNEYLLVQHTEDMKSNRESRLFHRNGNKIALIKELREFSNVKMRLIEAKLLVEVSLKKWLIEYTPTNYSH